MKRRKILISLPSFFVLLFTAVGLFFYFAVFAGQNSNFRPAEFLVKFKNDPEIYKIKISADFDIFSVIKNYQGNSEIEYLEPNYLISAAAFPNDPDYSLQWYLSVINARDAWSKELLIRQQEGITRQAIIAILDTGIDLDHPDLKDKIWQNQKEVANNNIDDDRNGYRDDKNGWDFVGNDNDPNPSFDNGYEESAVKHGTIVAGIAGASANNQIGISGVSWFGKIMPLRVLDGTGSGDVYSVIQAIDYAVASGADIINMSFVGTGYSQSLADAIRRAYDKDILVVAAAGNTDPAVNGVNLDITKSYPVCYDGNNSENMVIGIASVGKNLKKSGFSNYGACIDLVAPGESFYSTQVYEPKISGFTSYYGGYWSGTSLSAPLVSGTLALIKSLRPGFSAKEIKDFVLNNTKDISSYNPEYKGKLGFGLLDSWQALEAALGKKAPREKEGKSSYIVAGLGLGSFPQIKILKSDGTVFKAFYAYSPTFKGPINVATGDVNGDGKEEVITGAGFSGGPHVRVFNIEGQVVSQFFAYDDKFRGGVNIAVGDVSGDGKTEIIVGIGKGGLPEVKIFDYKGNLVNKFLAYDSKFSGGIKVATGDIDQDGKEEIIIGSGNAPEVKIFEADGKLISQFFAFNKYSKIGINVACDDLNGDGRAEIVASADNNSFPTIRVFTYQGKMLSNFFAYEPDFINGVHIAAGDLDNDGIAEIITGRGVGGDSRVKIFNLVGELKLQLVAHFENYRGGVRPAILWY